VTDTAAPPALARNVVEAWGDAGRRWLTDLPGLAAAVARDWDLDLDPGTPFVLSYNWVVAATRTDGTAAVLKLGLPEPGHLAREAAALDVFDGHGAVRLLAYDAERGALLLERAEPGVPARDLLPGHDEEATAVAVTVARHLHRPPPPGCALPDLVSYRGSFTGYLQAHPGDEPLPRHLVEAADRLFAELTATAPDRVVLHGDLHHDNLLSATREPWLAIDPHGVVGDPGFEIGALLYNPEPERRSGELLALVPARIEQLSDGLGQPVERVLAWGFVMAVLSEVWTTEGDGTPGSRALDVARLLYPRLP
jgi:streptomycin 6-kinase